MALLKIISCHTTCEKASVSVVSVFTMGKWRDKKGVVQLMATTLGILSFLPMPFYNSVVVM